MSRNRVADAAHISPFPRSLDLQEGQPSTSTSENGERGRQTKFKKGKDRPRQERSARAEEEMRFNIGPRAFRSIAGRGGRRPLRAGRQDSRSYNNGNNDGVPDYPPPSFLEAISTPALSVCPSTTTLIAGSSNVPLPFPESISDVMQRAFPSAASTQLSIRPPLASESDSESSIEIIEKGSVPVGGDSQLPSGPQLEERVKNDWRRRRGVDFPAPSSLHTDLSAIRSAAAVDGQSRGRSKQSRGVLDSDPELDSPSDTQPPTPISPKKRHLSLSPLRTLLPARILAFHDRSLSAHPSPGTSPYSASRSTTSFFRSTGSLATASFLGLPSVFGDSQGRSEGLARRLFSKGKEKERMKEASESESLDSWEILAPHEQQPHSLMGAVESLTDSPFSTNINSPTRCQSFSCASPVSSIFDISRKVALASNPGDERSRDFEETPNSTYLPFARDRTPAVTSSPFINRQVRRAAAISEEASPFPASNTPHMNAGPPLTSVRTRMPMEPASQSPVPSSQNATPTDLVSSRGAMCSPVTPVRMRPVPAEPSYASSISYPQSMAVIEAVSSRGIDSWKQEEMELQALFQRALETPLPVTPVSHVDSDYGTGDYSSLPVQYPVFAPSVTAIAGGIGISRDSSPDGLHDVEARSMVTNDRHAVYHAKPLNNRPYIARSAVQISVLERPPSPLMPEPMTPTRHHYLGRPLPRPPGPSRTLVDSTYAPHEDFPGENIPSRSDAHVPEGLLIDLDDSSSSGYSTSGNSTPRTDEARFRSQIHLPMAFSIASTPEPSDPGADVEFSRHDGDNLSPSPPLASSPIGLSDMTDLDLLISQLEDGSRNGNDYEALLLVQEFIGPASPSQRARNSQSSISEENCNVTLVGCVQIDRRRITTDGRIKLKLSLFDIAVDRCGICLSQFKGGELAVLSSVCRHTFHEECLGRWLARSQTCPMCRVHLDSDG